jgi:hypothetical protein
VAGICIGLLIRERDNQSASHSTHAMEMHDYKSPIQNDFDEKKARCAKSR